MEGGAASTRYATHPEPRVSTASYVGSSSQVVPEVEAQPACSTSPIAMSVSP
ncbi:hypothetical protein GSF22_22705 [Micromonospora echinofusca]|uniref:Uncharacterized protein n=1 Tax=Micromonospora echinofusca TaxID=47858 RepID=A0ABS3VWJ4_MICEH|nr:hypothetical protein [Micromonospora echinofusca]